MTMPLPIRHEIFAREMAAGSSAAAAARAAGYAGANARNQGSALMAAENVRNRIEALQAAAEATRQERVADIVARLRGLEALARECKDLRTALRCIDLEARLCGLLPGRAAPVSLAPDLENHLIRYEELQARSFPPRTEAPAEATLTDPDTAAPGSSPPPGAGGVGLGRGPARDAKNAPSPPSPGRAGGGSSRTTLTYPDISDEAEPAQPPESMLAVALRAETSQPADELDAIEAAVTQLESDLAPIASRRAA